MDFLLKHNKSQSALFSSPDEVGLRLQYRSSHPTEIVALKCMDGRLHLPIITKTPMGIIQPYRNLGGKFDLGWPYFQNLILEWYESSLSIGRDCVVLITYHFSKGDTHRGCKGFGYDTNAAKEAAFNLRRQFEYAFGKKHSVFYPLVAGIETDEDALVFHGNKKDIVFDLSLEKQKDTLFLEKRLQSLYPDMKPRVLADILPLVRGNLARIEEVRATKRTVEDSEHKEQFLCLGRGFDWLHMHNKALIVGPYSYHLADPIEKAAGILLDNLNSGRIPKKDGAIFMASAVYRNETGSEKLLAELKAESLAHIGLKTICEKTPKLAPYLKTIVGVTNLNNRLFTKINFNEKEYLC